MPSQKSAQLLIDPVLFVSHIPTLLYSILLSQASSVPKYPMAISRPSTQLRCLSLVESSRLVDVTTQEGGKDELK
jgi:hypothetical protein